MSDSSPDPVDLPPLKPLLPYGREAAAAAPASDRPPVITYLSAAMMMLGVLGVTCCGVVGGYTGLQQMANPQFVLSDGSVFRADPGIARYMFAQGTADFVLSLALVVAGLGGFYLKPWARKLAVVTSALLLVSGTVLLVANLRWIGPYKVAIAEAERDAMARVAATRPAATQQAATAPTSGPWTTAAATQPATQPATKPSISPDEAVAAIREQSRAVPFIMFVAGSIVPALVLATWTRQSVRERFERGPGGVG
ncbi:MAG TPA: hypothetical protein VF796_06220 [Humisphaera sp.]